MTRVLEPAALDLDQAQDLALGLAPVELAQRQRDALRERMLALAPEATSEGTQTLRADASPWIECAPDVHMKVLRRDAAARRQTLLLRMLPGGVLPGHRHTDAEEFIVLEGECHIGTHRLAAGDVHLASAGSWHEPVTTQTGVVVLLNGEYPPPGP